MATTPLWSPTPEQIREANLTAFIEAIAQRYDASIVDYSSLYNWSIRHPELFWGAVWDFCDIRATRRRDRVVEHFDRMPGAQWFPQARLNFAENLLRYRDAHPALVCWDETGRRRSLTYAELYRRVAGLVDALRSAGVQTGDRVAAVMPNLPETVIAMLATTSLGAVWSSCSPDFGPRGVLDRFGQIQPKVLFTVDGYTYAGKSIDLGGRLREILDQLPDLEKVVVLPYRLEMPNLKGVQRWVRFQDFAGPGSEAPIEFPEFPFDHPLYIMYSSGTTGLPKCMVHGAGGTLIQHLKELVLHSNLKRHDRIFYATTCGWMMWNWMISSLAVGATVLLYEGSPLHPRKEILFDFAEKERMTVFGTSAKYLAVIEKKGLRPMRTHDLSHLLSILSTGSPLIPQSFDYVYRDVKKDVRLSSISGGTDLISCFALGNPIGPVYRGQLQARGLGMKVEIFDEAGASLKDGTGELVCTQPFPSMPVRFWRDGSGEKYRKAYFDIFPGVWRHGDWARLTAQGGMVIYGRSDTTLNPAGVRIGTAEIYRQVEQLEEILESLAVAQEWKGDVRIILFVKMKEGQVLTEALKDRIRKHLRQNNTPRHVPRKILAVKEIPRTISGKVSEVAVREVIHGRPVENIHALANPETLELYRNLSELRKP